METGEKIQVEGHTFSSLHFPHGVEGGQPPSHLREYNQGTWVYRIMRWLRHGETQVVTRTFFSYSGKRFVTTWTTGGSRQDGWESSLPLAPRAGEKVDHPGNWVVPGWTRWLWRATRSGSVVPAGTPYFTHPTGSALRHGPQSGLHGGRREPFRRLSPDREFYVNRWLGGSPWQTPKDQGPLAGHGTG